MITVTDAGRQTQHNSAGKPDTPLSWRIQSRDLSKRMALAESMQTVAACSADEEQVESHRRHRIGL